MLTKMNAYVVVTIVIVLVGASLDAVPSAWAQIATVGPLPVGGCDNKCRNKNVIYYCDGGTNSCINYYTPTCLVCNADLYSGTKQCMTDSSGTTDTCQVKISPQIPYAYVGACTTICGCGTGGVPTVDAFANVLPSGGGNTDLYTCGGR